MGYCGEPHEMFGGGQLTVEDSEGRAHSVSVVTVTCTGWAASWCPVHGDCSCPRDRDGGRSWGDYDEDCPLHGDGAEHGEAVGG
jgi:hypothetical protein